MSDISFGAFHFKGLSDVNILLGKNGVGKSHVLRQAQQHLVSDESYGLVKYLSPERGGALTINASVDQNISTPNWMATTRNQNQTAQFREQSTSQYVVLELLTLREIAKANKIGKFVTDDFDTVVVKINSLLDRVQIQTAEKSFEIVDSVTGELTPSDALSSGESELISLAIECLVFEKQAIDGKLNLLLFDEPDVHLHPDLQFRLAQFLIELGTVDGISIVIATHSTPFVSALAQSKAHISFMKFGTTEIEFSPLDDIYEKVLPILGAHPLSSVFNESPILLLEGLDDERLWQQVVRSSTGKLKLYPCGLDGIDDLPDFESRAVKILNSVYDNPIGYSLRDRDDGREDIDDMPPIIRMRLSCRASENLLLSDDVLTAHDMSWNGLQQSIDDWIANNQSHPKSQFMEDFRDSGYDRKSFDLKQIRLVLMGLLGSNKPWEVAVGQVIAGMSRVDSPSPDSLQAYLGEKVCQNLLG